MIKHFARKFLIEGLHEIEASSCQVPDHSYDFAEIKINFNVGTCMNVNLLE